MGIKFAGAAALFVSSLAVAAPAYAAVEVNPTGVPPITAGSCGAINFTGVTELACAGGYEKNLLKGSVDAPGLAALQERGYTGGANFLEKIENLSGNTVNFNTMLTGITYIGIHYGAGSGIGNASSFFKLDAGTGVDLFSLLKDNQNFKGLSNAAIFSTGGENGGGGGVPEPATWALMIMGFGAVGGAMRVRRRAVHFAA